MSEVIQCNKCGKVIGKEDDYYKHKYMLEKQDKKWVDMISPNITSEHYCLDCHASFMEWKVKKAKK